jgi:hypothetical protein
LACLHPSSHSLHPVLRSAGWGPWRPLECGQGRGCMNLQTQHDTHKTAPAVRNGLWRQDLG